MSATLDRLIQLQNLVKRDPEGYAEEFRLQLKNFNAEVEVLRMSNASSGGATGAVAFGQGSADGRGDFAALTMFLAHVCACYPVEMAAFPQTVLSLLEKNADSLDGEVRRTLVQALILMRNKGRIPPVPLLKAFFSLFRVRDKTLREILFSHIVADLKTLAGGRSHKHAPGNTGKDRKAARHAPPPPASEAADSAAACRSIQAHLYSLVSDSAPPVSAKRSLDVLIELYRRHVWTDARTVNVIAQALTSARPKLLVTATKFFLNLGSGEAVAEEGEDDDDDDGTGELAGAGKRGNPNVDPKAVRALEEKMQHAKKTRKKVKQLAKQLTALKKSKAKGGEGPAPVFPAIQLLHDPQGLAEKMLGGLRKSTNRFEVRLLLLNLLTRIVGTHRLLLLPLYSFLQRYMSRTQTHVTQILAYLLQAVHELVPPDEVTPIVRLIANNFITETAGPETMQVGMNALRELLSRCPTVLEEEGMGDLLSDLVMYRKSQSKGVIAAARSILNLVREWYPSLLRRRDRGREASTDAVKGAARPGAYGARHVATGVEGTDLLALALARKAQRQGMDEDFSADEFDGEEEEEEGEGDDDAMGHSEATGALTARSLPLDASLLSGMQDQDEWVAAQVGQVKTLRAAGKAKEAKALLAALRVSTGVYPSKPDSMLRKTAGAGGPMLRLPSRGRHARQEEEDEEADDIADLLAGEEEDEEEDEEEASGAHAHSHGHAKVGRSPEKEDVQEEDEEEEDDEEDEDEDDEEEEEEGEEVMSMGRGSSRVASSKASQKAALAEALGPLLGRGKAASSAQLEATRILTPKDFARIKAMQAKLEEKGLHVHKPGDLLAILQGDRSGGGGEEGGARVAGKKRRGTVSDEEWARLQMRKKRKSGRGLGISEEDGGGEAEVEEEDDQLAMPGVSYAPPVSSFDPMAIEAVETSHKRKQADRLLDLLKTKQAGSKGKFDGKRSGGGLTNDEKRRMKNYVMLRKSGAVAGKLRRSLKEQNRVLKGRIKGQKTMDKRKKQKRRRA